MAAFNPFRLAARLSAMLFGLSLVLPLYRGGEYVGGYTTLVLIVRTARQSAVHFEGLVCLWAHVLFLVLLPVVFVVLYWMAFPRAARATVVVLFLAAMCSVLMANTRTHVYPVGPSAIALFASACAGVLGLGWPVYDRRRR